MPQAIRPICGEPGCLERSRKGKSRCQKHEWRGNSTPQQSVNTAFWQRLRARILSAEPICRACAKGGLIELAVEVDHIIPRYAGGTHDPSNLQPLCRECHHLKTLEEIGHRKRHGAQLSNR